MPLPRIRLFVLCDCAEVVRPRPSDDVVSKLGVRECLLDRANWRVVPTVCGDDEHAIEEATVVCRCRSDGHHVIQPRARAQNVGCASRS
jgi:hypothetical protein